MIEAQAIWLFGNHPHQQNIVTGHPNFPRIAERGDHDPFVIQSSIRINFPDKLTSAPFIDPVIGEIGNSRDIPSMSLLN
ncbi:MAG: hypothetical protein Q7R22_003770 [Verrucomicrobiota bacterium JB025]